MKGSLVTALMITLLASLHGNSVDPGMITFAPHIISHPQNVTAIVSETVTFTSNASGVPEASRSWQRSTDGGVIWSEVVDTPPFSGVGTNTLTISGVPLAMNGDLFRSVAANDLGSAISNHATLSVTKIPASVMLGDLGAVYDGSPHAIAATTSPAGLTVVITYNDSPIPPTDAGNYAVVATVFDDFYTGNATGTLTVTQAAHTIDFPAPPNIAFSTEAITLNANTSSGLPVIFSLVSGPAALNNNLLTPTGVGSVTVKASQGGDKNYRSASDVYRSFSVFASLLSWNEEHFSSGELADASISGPVADPDNDGLTNLLEYALNLNPKSVNTTGLPEMGASATAWTYTYTRPADRADLTYEVETSTDLVNWTTAGVTHTMSAELGTEQIWQASVPIESVTSMFFRLKITQN